MKIQASINDTENKISELDNDIVDIEQRMAKAATALEPVEAEAADGTSKLPSETQREFLIRTGKINPFSKFGSGNGDESRDVDLLGAELEAMTELASTEQAAPLSHQNLKLPGLDSDSDSDSGSALAEASRPVKRRRLKSESPSEVKTAGLSDDDFIVDDNDEEEDDADDDDADVSHLEEDSDGMPSTVPEPNSSKRKKRSAKLQPTIEDLRSIDDGNEANYQQRLRKWTARRKELRDKEVAKNPSNFRNNGNFDPDAPEWTLPHPTVPSGFTHAELRIPGDIYQYLFDYQRTGVSWLAELRLKGVGGIVGDEMGLGKTIQIISYVASLHHSNKLHKPVLIVCPATVMKQWVQEFHRWWPAIRVSILHSSGSGMIDIKKEMTREERLMESLYDTNIQFDEKLPVVAQKVLRRVVDKGHVLITTYTGLQTYRNIIIPVQWELAVLDEGHKIRNPNTSITIWSKEIRTPHRIILSGTPIQNNLTELWSLFDFVYPMRLGTLVDFKNQFEFPIKQGSYVNASNLQIQTATRCAETLKEAISPYLLQRYKVDVAADLPKKTELVIFCKLTPGQIRAYRRFLASDDVQAIWAGKRQALYGIDILRKICNHPDLQGHDTLQKTAGYNYGELERSGKMIVVKQFIEVWRKEGHKVLLFAQHRIMLDILEKFIKSLDGFNYLRMDGNTPIAKRQPMVDDFNRNPDLHIFLLTTKVGGLGVNLTGASRVIIYDPDWNPSTDVQARERAWRLGQKKEVKIVRLMTAGTIEEKIYHRQIFKQVLTNKVLKDPTQRQNFEMKDLHDLFQFEESVDGSTETGRIFTGAHVDMDNGDGNTNDGATTKHEVQDSELAGTAGVAAIEEMDEPIPNPTSSDPSTTEDKLLSGIFARGVHSALEHDSIVNGRRKIEADARHIDRDARRTAAEAAASLCKAEAAAKSVPIGTVTWTGQVGTGGRNRENDMGFDDRDAGSDILAAVAKRNRPAAPAAPTSFKPQLKTFFQRRGGTANSSTVIASFSKYVKDPSTKDQFERELREVADMQRASHGGSVRWHWKDVDALKRRRRGSQGGSGTSGTESAAAATARSARLQASGRKERRFESSVARNVGGENARKDRGL